MDFVCTLVRSTSFLYLYFIAWFQTSFGSIHEEVDIEKTLPIIRLFVYKTKYIFERRQTEYTELIPYDSN